MPYVGYESFTTEPDTVDQMHCKVCGTLCNVDRSLHGPTGFAESLARRGHWLDRFVRPHTGKSWHYEVM